jgi:hypothetical protein
MPTLQVVASAQHLPSKDWRPSGKAPRDRPFSWVLTTCPVGFCPLKKSLTYFEFLLDAKHLAGSWGHAGDPREVYGLQMGDRHEHQ